MHGRCGTKVLSYLEHSHQSAAFRSPGDLSRHRLRIRQPHSLRGYSGALQQQSRWLDFLSLLNRYVQGSRLAIVSSRPWSGLFRGVEYRSSSPIRPAKLFPIRLRLCCFVTGKGLMPLSSFSFSLRHTFHGRTGGCPIRPVCVATAGLPTPACVKRTLRAFHPIGHCRLWSESRRGIGKSLVLPHPLCA